MVERTLCDEAAVLPGRVAGPGGRRELPVSAEKILRAARMILVRDGYDCLTLAAIGREAGVSRALVHYHFGSKAGLLEAVVMSLFEDPAFGFSDQVVRTVEGPARAEALLSWQGRIIEDDHTSRLLFELLPHMMRDEDLRHWAALLYASYRDFDGTCLHSAAPAMDDATVRALATLTVAVVEGLSVQRVIDADGVDHPSAFSLWRDMVSTLLAGGTKNRKDRSASS
jgi:AcrR family transcriptional regulator